MTLSREEANQRADQIIREAEQTSIRAQNAKAKRVRMPLLFIGNRQLRQLEPYQRVKLLNKAKELALDHPLFNKALYVYILSALVFLKYFLIHPHFGAILNNYFLALLGAGIALFEIYRAYLVHFYLKKLLSRCAQ